MITLIKPAIVQSMFMLLFIFLVCGLFDVKRNCADLFIICLYELPLDIKLSRGEGWNAINRFNPTTFLCLSQASTRISNVICRGYFKFNEFR